MQNIGWDVFKINVITLSSMESGYVVQDDNIMVFVWSFIIQYLYEAQDVQSCDSVFGQSRVEYKDSFSTPYDVYAVGYCVSVCSNIWNVDLSLNEGGSELFEMLVYGLNSVEYGRRSIERLDFPDVREL